MKRTTAVLISVIVLITSSLSISVTIFAAYLKAPVIDTIVNHTEGIKITWDEVYGATAYRVYRRGAGEGYWTYLETVNTTHYLDKNTVSGNYYRYTLRASDGSTFGSYDPEGKYTKRLENPHSFTATNKTNGIEVTWAPVEGALGYRVYRRGAGEAWTYIKTISTTSYLDKIPLSGKYYRYTARAVCGKYTSFYSSEGALLKRLSDPASITATNRGDGVLLTWNGVSGASSYRVYRRGAGETWTYLKTVTDKYYLDTSVKKNTLYRYTVRAVSGTTFSFYSSQGALIKHSEPMFKSIINTTYAESYASINSTLTKLAALYPDKIKITSLGKSEANYNIPMITLGNGDKKALIIGAIHAREHITTKYILRCVEDYCFAATSKSGKIGSYNARNMLNEYTLYIVPCVNPDGLEIIRSRLTPQNYKVKNLNEYKANYNGVDLNRNFPLAWEQINNGVNAPADYYFKGYSAADQKETQALMNLCNSNEFEFMLSIHIKGNCLYWGDTYNTQHNAEYKAFAKDIANACDFYMPNPTTKPSSYGGGFENWFRHTYNRPGVCIELSDVENTIKPCDNSNYTDFDGFVNYNDSKYAIAAAMASASGD